MAEKKMFIISFDGINDTQRNQVQTRVERNAKKWFHRQKNVWIVESEGLTSADWREQVKGFVDGVPGTVLIFELPELGSRRFSGFAPPSWFAWLRGDYMKGTSSDTEAVGS